MISYSLEIVYKSLREKDLYENYHSHIILYRFFHKLLLEIFYALNNELMMMQ